MKKTLLSVFFVVISFAVYADDDTREIELYSIDITTRSITVLPEALPADGMEYSYDLSGIGEGLHRLVIKGPGGEFEGYFTLY